VHESGGASWSQQPGGDPPGAAAPRLHVVVWVRDPASVDVAGLERAIRDAQPVHMPCQIEVRASTG